MKVAAAQYIGLNAPKGLLATFNGIAGGLHYGIGRGCGGLIGGYLISVTGDIALVFRMFGVVSAVCGVIYLSYEYCVKRLLGCFTEATTKEPPLEEKVAVASKEIAQPFMADVKA